MANLAFGKLPLEKDKWLKPEEATDGVITGYTGNSGFASSFWPCNYTLDLEAEIRIKVIRFLLWDNLGKVNNTIDDRKYRFSLSISSDGINYTTIYSNQDQSGSNGWFSFRLTGSPYVRYIKLSGLFNTANKEFHIVEFEVYDEEPLQLTSTNVQSYDLVTGIVGEKRITELIENLIAQKSATLAGVEEKIGQLDASIIKSNQALEQIELIKKSIDFETEASNNSSRASKWLIASFAIIAIFIYLLYYFVYCDSTSYNIIENAAKSEDTKPYTTIFLWSFYAGKAILISALLFALGWTLKNYRSEKHNYVINKHKAMSLTVATGVLTKEEYKNTDKETIFNEAMKIILTHQSSGFSKEETSSPSIINTLLQKDMPKINPS